jgi:hypothetical protein
LGRCTGTPVGREHELEAGRVLHRAVGPREPDLPLFQRAAERVKQARSPLRGLIEEENAEVPQCPPMCPEDRHRRPHLDVVTHAMRTEDLHRAPGRPGALTARSSRPFTLAWPPASPTIRLVMPFSYPTEAVLIEALDTAECSPI